MSGKSKRNSAASTYSSSKKRRERDLSPSSDSQQGSDTKDSPPEKSKKSSEKKKANGSKRSDDSSHEASLDGEEEEEEEFEVTTIKSHRQKRGTTQYLVGWKGYKSDSDTWEPADNLLPGAVELLKQYRTAHALDLTHKSGRVSDASAKSKRSAKADDSDQSEDDDDQKNRKRKRLSHQKSSSTIAPLRKNGTSGPTKADRDSVKNRKPARSESEESDSESVNDEQWHERHKKLPNWEDLIRSVRTIEKPSSEDEDAPNDHTINVCLLWNNGRVSWVSNKIARDKLPHKMLDFYEDHLQFSSVEK